MSAATKEQAKTTEHHLKNAEQHLRSAEQSSQNTGDGSLIQKVTKIREAVTETRKDLSTKLDGG